MPNPRTRARRLKLFAVPFILAGALAYGSVHQIWYTATLSPTTVQGQSVQASLTLTGADIANLSQSSTTPSAGLTSANANPSVGSKFGLIDPVFYVVLAALLGALGALAGSVLLTFGSLLSSAFAWTQLSSLRTQFENPLTTGGFTLLRGPGQARLWLALTIMVGFGALSLVQVVLVHRAQRIANNEPPLAVALIAALGARVTSVIRDTATVKEHDNVH